MLWTYILKLVILLPLVCGLMFGCLYLWRKFESRMPGRIVSSPMMMRTCSESDSEPLWPVLPAA